MEPISFTDAVLLIVFCPILLAVAISDMKHLRIPNTMVMAGLGLFLLCAPLLGGSEAMMRAAISVLAFVVCAGLFAIRVMGGGDAKMIPVVFLFIPSEMAVRYLIVFGWCLPLGMMLVFLARRSVHKKLAGWASLKADAEFPIGVSIALSGVIFLSYAAKQGTL